MSAKQKPVRKAGYYMATARFQGKQVGQEQIIATDRRLAVRQSVKWFRSNFGWTLGSIDKALIVSDPYHEVTYDDDFDCRDMRNKFLPPGVINNLMVESKGALKRGTIHSMQRVKRRRLSKVVTVAPNVLFMHGAFHYRIIKKPQRSRNGLTLQPTGYQDVRLEAKDFAEAAREIQERGLHKQHSMATKKKRGVRELSILHCIAGLMPEKELDSELRTTFGTLIRKYKKVVANTRTAAAA